MKTMKAKAGFLMLLAFMVCFTGFGNTTTDPVQNSTAVHSDFDVGIDQVNVVIENQVIDLAVNDYQFSVNTSALSVTEMSLIDKTNYALFGGENYDNRIPIIKEPLKQKQIKPGKSTIRFLSCSPV
jgi:hypothetical protein